MPWQQWLQFLAGVVLAIGGVLAITSGRGTSARGEGAEGAEEPEQPGELPGPEAGGREGRRAERLARARAHNEARRPFLRLSSEEKAAELRRLSRSSFAAPVGGIGSAHSSFRRDDRIYTDLRALLDETESEIAAGEHIAAAYRLRDAASSTPQPVALVTAGLRRASLRLTDAGGGAAYGGAAVAPAQRRSHPEPAVAPRAASPQPQQARPTWPAPRHHSSSSEEVALSPAGWRDSATRSPVPGERSHEDEGLISPASVRSDELDSPLDDGSRPWNAWDTSNAAVSPVGIAKERDEKWASGGGGPPAESTDVSNSSEPSSEWRAAAGEPSSEPASAGAAEAAELKLALAATAEELANAQATIRALEARLSSA
mmetsp:Transcript_8373/g.26173  ORF Transcript_8373/g.26173 Transcript_8373/m.26173 type:complete len:372 (-) Transcript_8373:306-1421(-)